LGDAVAPGGEPLMFFTGLWDFFTSSANWQGPKGIPQRTLEQLQYSGIALAIAIVIGLPLGLIIGHAGRGNFIITIANTLRGLPTYGLLVFFVLVFSNTFKGKTDLPYIVPTEIVLTVLAIPGIIANTAAGVQNVDATVRDAARGMGMRGGQVLRRVELPIALPLILSGLRNASLQVFATATVAAQIGLGGLGRYIIDGIQQGLYYSETAPGAVLVAVLALVIDLLWALATRLVVSRGLTGHYRRAAAPLATGPTVATAPTGSTVLTGGSGEPAAQTVS
jgi:osmoprotectant transport system permease protein